MEDLSHAADDKGKQPRGLHATFAFVSCSILCAVAACRASAGLLQTISAITAATNAATNAVTNAITNASPAAGIPVGSL